MGLPTRGFESHPLRFLRAWLIIGTRLIHVIARDARQCALSKNKNAWLFQAKRLNNSNSIPEKLLALDRWRLWQIALLPINGDLVFHDLSDNHFQIAAIISIDKRARAFNDFL